MLSSALSPCSRQSYQRAWQLYVQFSGRFCDTFSPSLPLDVTSLALFISYMTARKFAHSTICSYISAISYVHKLRGLTDPTKSFLISKLLTAHRRANPQLDVRLPITRPVLHSLVRSLEFTSSSSYQRLLYTAMFLTAFYGFFRLGELASKNTRTASLVVQYDQLTFLLENNRPVTAKISISHYKHSLAKRPFDILINRESSQPFCPVDFLLQFCASRGHVPGPLFCMPDLSPISVSVFNRQLNTSLSFCGLDTSRYKPHGFRIGAASHAAASGLSDAQIRFLGRWSSDAFKVYIRPESF